MRTVAYLLSLAALLSACEGKAKKQADATQQGSANVDSATEKPKDTTTDTYPKVAMTPAKNSSEVHVNVAALKDASINNKALIGYTVQVKGGICDAERKSCKDMSPPPIHQFDEVYTLKDFPLGSSQFYITAISACEAPADGSTMYDCDGVTQGSVSVVAEVTEDKITIITIKLSPEKLILSELSSANVL